MRRKVAQLTLLVLMSGSIAACGSVAHDGSTVIQRVPFDPATDPYWANPVWDKSLLDAVQSVVHDPVDPGDISTPGLHAVVKFIYIDGTIEYPEIVQSTGDQDLDKLMLHQVISVQV